MKLFVARLVFAVILILSPYPAALAASGKAKADNPRLIDTSSPYLRGHSRDLVQWYTWEEATFERARKLNLPLMVSFGYNACHWCHVMQETHFNDEAIAETINQKFIPVLVDRERRTALDELYLLVTEALTKQGGWPNTVFIHADQKPFYATTFVTPDRFTKMLSAITQAWEDDKASLVEEAGKLARVISEFTSRKEKAEQLSPALLTKMATQLAAQFDPFFGGIGESAKFYQQPLMMFLLQQMERDKDPMVHEAVTRTLQAVMAGGVQDHLAGGFHRYSVDPAWLVPHFEKMLYDQAQLAELFVEAYRITGAPEYAFTARKTLDYVLDDLTSPQGGFYSTRDADSEGEEGTYYVWTPEDFEKILGPQDGKYATELFGVLPGGEQAGKIVINFFDSQKAISERLGPIMGKLAAARTGRIAPARDEKIVATWNGLMIASLARAAIVLGEEKYAKAAVGAATFVWDNMRGSNGGLMRIAFKGESEIEAELDDFAQMARGFLHLYDATSDRMWLNRAQQLTDEMIDLFQDPKSGDFYATRTATGFGKFKSRRDIDIASGNGAALDVIARLAKRSPEIRYKREAERVSATLSGIAVSSPTGGTSILAAADRHLRGETGTVQYAGEGNVQANLIPQPDGKTLRLILNIAPGWHVNAKNPLDDFLVPTKLELFDDDKQIDAEMIYPEPVTKKLAFNKKPMALLENVVEFVVTRPPQSSAVPSTTTLAVDVQTCSDEICLLPETLYLSFSWPQL